MISRTQVSASMKSVSVRRKADGNTPKAGMPGTHRRPPEATGGRVHHDQACLAPLVWGGGWLGPRPPLIILKNAGVVLRKELS